MQKVVETIILAVGGLALLALLSFLLSWPTYALWNGCLVGAVTAVRPITWLQAWGISCLCSMLFKPTVSKKA